MFALRAGARSARLARVPARGMAGGHGPAKEYTGIEKVVRGVLKKDEHLVLGIVGFYATLALLFKMKPSKPAPAAAPIAAAPSTADGDIPSVESPTFSAWIEAPGNADKWFAALAK
eukprot:TRINITY_DN2632_c1_g1_i1.p2 TRINITY_DN2632_c1_g1~~TRINITY_DN2632_c1_g1_i1.p2  ORF type:complete len:116 (+),score=25.90 TRINITY_DN2632_c1_g1_i1:119-466(+)